MSLHISFRAIPPTEPEPEKLSRLLRENQMLRLLLSSLKTLQSCQEDSHVLFMTLSLMTEDFKVIGENARGEELSDAQVEDIRGLLLRTNDMLDGIGKMDGKVAEAAGLIRDLGDIITKDVRKRIPQTT